MTCVQNENVNIDFNSYHIKTLCLTTTQERKHGLETQN